MAPKTGPSLKELMRNRNKTPSPKDKNKSKPLANPPPPPPQVPADLRLKPNPDLRRKRPVELPRRGSWAPQKKINRPDRHRTTGAGGPTPWTTERNPRRPKYVGLHELGHPYWRLTVRPSRLMPHLGIFVGVMQACWLRLCNSLSSFPRTWRPIGVLIILTSSFP